MRLKAAEVAFGLCHTRCFTVAASAGRRSTCGLLEEKGGSKFGPLANQFSGSFGKPKPFLSSKSANKVGDPLF